MRVLINGLQAGNRSGTGVYTEQLVRRLPGLADDVEVWVAWPRRVPPPSSITEPNRVLLRGGTGLLGRIYYDQVAFHRDGTRLGANVLHYPANVGGLRRTAKQVVTLHDLSFYQEPSWYRFERAAYYRWAVARSLRHADRVIAVSRATAREVSERLGFPENRISVVPNGVDERFRPATAAEKEAILANYNLPARYFLYVGTLEPRKNLSRLIRAWSAIANRCEQDLVLAGRPGWKHSPVHAEAHRSAYPTRIHFPGFVATADLPTLMSGADAFVYPSLYEGFGIPVAEAMACGTPVLTSKTTSLPEVAGDAALLVDPENTEAMSEALHRLARDAELRAQLATKGLARAVRYSWQRTAELTLDVYRAALDG